MTGDKRIEDHGVQKLSGVIAHKVENLISLVAVLQHRQSSQLIDSRTKDVAPNSLLITLPYLPTGGLIISSS